MEQLKSPVISMLIRGKLSLLSIKKAAVLFILGSMLVNGFAYGATEASRNSFVIVATVVAGQTINQIFSKCNDSLVEMSNKISRGISELLMSAFGVEAGFSGSKREKQEEKGASGAGASGEIALAKERRQIGSIEAVSVNTFERAEKLFKLYMNYKIPSEAAGIPIMMFIMFVIGIRQRKEITASVKIIFNIVQKTRISA